jgi:hypothetical protein
VREHGGQLGVGRLVGLTVGVVELPRDMDDLPGGDLDAVQHQVEP